MSAAIRYDIIADRGCRLVESFSKVGVNWTGATMKLQVRQVPDASGSPALSYTLGSGLTLSYAGTDTIANHIAAGRLPNSIDTLINPATGFNYALTDSVTVSVVAFIVEGTALVSPTIPYGTPLGADWVGAYDLLVDDDGAGAHTYAKQFFGVFTVRGTVSQ